MTTAAHRVQFDVNPRPSNLASGWLPPYGSAGMQAFFDRILDAPHTPLAPSVQALATYIEDNGVAQVVRTALDERGDAAPMSLLAARGQARPRIRDIDTLLHGFNTVLTQAPAFYDGELVGLPFSALATGIDPACGATNLFRLPTINLLTSAILRDWGTFLDSPASNTGFRTAGEQWMTPAVMDRYGYRLYEKDAPALPAWRSWNAFFTRAFEDPQQARPVADPASNDTVVSPNDGTLFRWDRHIDGADRFWFKDMRYALADILSSPDPAQQDTIDAFRLRELFDGGAIFQTSLSPYDFHRWWAPVNGEVLFDPFVIPGCFFNRLILPHAASGPAGASVPYLAKLNARGLIVFKTEDHGHVCCIPLGMSEASSVAFDPAMRRGATVRKGQEMGMFNYGGSSFAVIYEKLPGKELVFLDAEGVPTPNRSNLFGAMGQGGHPVRVGARIGVWHTRK